MWILFLLLIAAGMLAALAIYAHVSGRELWSPHNASGALMMRRKVDGIWQYRKATPAEHDEFIKTESW